MGKVSEVLKRVWAGSYGFGVFGLGMLWKVKMMEVEVW